METEWIITEVDGKIASVGADYRHFADIAGRIAALPPKSIGMVKTRKVSTPELVELDRNVRWEDLRLFGSKFQIAVWRKLFELTHEGGSARLLSYSDFAVLCDNAAGVRAVAHAVAVNPVAYLIPCHLVIPKESVDKGRQIRSHAQETTLFRGDDLYLLDTLDVGEYAYGSPLKRELIKLQLGK